MAIGTPVLRATEFQQDAPSTTVNITTTSSIAAGSKIFIWLQTRTTTQVTMTITNNGGYTLTWDYHSASFVTQAISMNIGVATVPSGGIANTTQFTATTSGTTGKQIINVAEVTGLADQNSIHNNGAGGSGAPNSGSVTTTSGEENALMFGAFAEGGAGTLSVSANSSGFTTLQPAATLGASSPLHGFAEYKIRSTTGTDTENPTENLSTNNAAVIVTYLAAVQSQPRTVSMVSQAISASLY